MHSDRKDSTPTIQDFLYRRPIPTAERALQAEHIRQQMLVDKTVYEIEAAHHEMSQQQAREKEAIKNEAKPAADCKDESPKPALPESKDVIAVPSDKKAQEIFSNQVNVYDVARLYNNGAPYDLTSAIVIVDREKDNIQVALRGADQDFKLHHQSWKGVQVNRDTIVSFSSTQLRFWRKKEMSMHLSREHALPAAFEHFSYYFAPPLDKFIVAAHYNVPQQVSYTLLMVFDSDTTKLLFTKRIEGYEYSQRCFFVYPNYVAFPGVDTERDYGGKNLYRSCVDLWRIDYDKQSIGYQCSFAVGNKFQYPRIFNATPYGYIWYTGEGDWHELACFFQNGRLYRPIGEAVNLVDRYRAEPVEYKIADDVLGQFIPMPGIRNIVDAYYGSHRFLMFKPHREYDVQELTKRNNLDRWIRNLEKQITADEKKPQLDKEVKIKETLKKLCCDFQTLINSDDFMMYRDSVASIRKKYTPYFELTDNNWALFGSILNGLKSNFDVHGICYDVIQFIESFKELDEGRVYEVQPFVRGYIPPVMGR
jgi:hypothetical protein